MDCIGMITHQLLAIPTGNDPAFRFGQIHNFTDHGASGRQGGSQMAHQRLKKFVAGLCGSAFHDGSKRLVIAIPFDFTADTGRKRFQNGFFIRRPGSVGMAVYE